MSTGPGPLVSNYSEPSNQMAAIATVTISNTANSPTPGVVSYSYTPNGTLDTLFSDTVDLPAFQLYRGIFVTVAGNMKWQDHDGNICGPAAIPVGTWPIRPKLIYSTLTTVSGVFGYR